MVRNCLVCQAPQAIGDRFCGVCGAELASIPPPRPAECSACGQPGSPEARFCIYCGAPLDLDHSGELRTPPDSRNEVPRYMMQPTGQPRPSIQSPALPTSPSSSSVSTIFGSVSDNCLTFFRGRGWVRGGTQEDIPLRHVTSISSGISRKILLGILSIVIGLASLIFVVGILPLAVGILLLWGSPSIRINTAGGDLQVMKGWPWHKGAANKFASAVRERLFRE